MTDIKENQKEVYRQKKLILKITVIHCASKIHFTVSLNNEKIFSEKRELFLSWKKIKRWLKVCFLSKNINLF